MQENPHQQIYLLLFMALQLWLQICFKQHFQNVRFNYFTYQGHGMADYPQDLGINVIIITCNKNKYPCTCPKHIHSIYSDSIKASQ